MVAVVPLNNTTAPQRQTSHRLQCRQGGLGEGKPVVAVEGRGEHHDIVEALKQPPTDRPSDSRRSPVPTLE